MKKNAMAWAGMMVLLMAAGAVAGQPDAAGCADHPLFPTRMPDYRLAACKIEDFGVYEFFSVKGPKTPVEGKFTFLTYDFTGQKAREPSGLAVVRNYENAIQKVGGTILQSVPDRWVNGKIVKDGLEVWAQIEKGNGKIWLRIVEKRAMEQFIVADAASLGNDLNTMGHAAVYGILFDTGKSVIKPESAQAIGEIAKILTSDPALKIYVVGHTDNEGTLDGNMKLSMDRAQAVVQALTSQHGVALARLKAFGCGPYSPVAINGTEEGKAKNRRVELVKQ
jgi:OOP family OmpA-OmpF porin